MNVYDTALTRFIQGQEAPKDFLNDTYSCKSMAIEIILMTNIVHEG